MSQLHSNGWSTLWMQADPTGVKLTLQEYRDTARMEITRDEMKHIIREMKRILRESKT